MHEWITEELGRATAGSRELDDACERVAERLFAEGTEPPFDVRTADLDVDGFLIAADRYWRLRILARPTVGTAMDCARWIAVHVAEEYREPIEQKWALGYGFITMDSIETAREVEEITGRILGEAAAQATVAYFAMLYHASKLRAGFCHDDLDDFLRSPTFALAAGRRVDEPIVTALRAFAAFGQLSVTSAWALELLDRAWSAPGRGRQVVDVCLNGLWLGALEDDGLAGPLRDRAEQAVAEFPGDHLFHYRLATGLRLCGEYESARRAIALALQHLPKTGSRGSHKLLLEQYSAERGTNATQRRLAGLAARLEERVDRQDAEAAELRRVVQASTTRTIEVVAFFTAAIAFAVGSVQVTLVGDLALPDRAALLGIFAAGLIGFSLAITAGTWFITRVRER